MEIKYFDKVNEVEGIVPLNFIEKYLKIKGEKMIITNSGISVLISEYSKIGKLNMECKSCLNHDKLKIELNKIASIDEDTFKGFIVKAKDPYFHLTSLCLRKKNGIISIFITDTQGGEANYDPSTLIDIKELNIKSNIYNLMEKREWESTREGAFAFHDLLMMSRYSDSLFDDLEAIDRELTNLPYLSKVKFKPIYLKDLPREFSKFKNLPVSEETKYVQYFKNVPFNILSHHHFTKYMNIIKERLKYEYHVKTTYDGDILTPRGLNILIKLEGENGTLKTQTIALETHDEFRKIIFYIIKNNQVGTLGFLIKSKDPHDHITPVYFRRYENGDMKVILMDTGGGQSYYDPSVLWDFVYLKLKIKIYNLVERRQWDNNTCPIFSYTDIVNLSQMKDPFEYCEEITKNRNYEKVKSENPPNMEFKPLYLQDLPIQFMFLTTRFATLQEYSKTLLDDDFMKTIEEHLIEVHYAGRIIKSNFWAEELNQQYAEIIRSSIF